MPSRLDIPRTSSLYPDDISPPDSPRTTDGRGSSPNVSPISTAGSGFKSKSSTLPYTSNIPLPNHQQPGGASSYISGWREKVGVGHGSVFGTKDKKTRLDTHSGEPNSERGRTGPVLPGSAPYDRADGMGTTSTITSIQQPQPRKEGLFSSTLKKVGKRDALSFDPKEPWKGASGRAPVIAPVEEKPDPGKSKAFPTPSERRKAHGLRQASGFRQAFTGRDSPAPEPDRNLSMQVKRSRDKAHAPEYTVQHPDPDPPSRERTVSPFPPRLDSHLDFGQRMPDSNHVSGLDNDQQDTFTRSILQDQYHTPSVIVETPDRVETPQQFATHSQPIQFSESQLRHAVQHMDISNEPSSRFSATTYATTVPDSPPGTPDLQRDDAPPVPDLPAPSVLNRKRPIAPSGINFGSKPPSRKPTPSAATMEGPDAKTLPSAPEEETPIDRVTQLEAKLASLQKRRANIKTVIHELTHVVQPSSIEYDLASRNEIKRTVESLTTENAVIEKEIHETGLKLHRAFKKRDENSLYEPTGLWVRRVTE
jgi:hypothetical protein